MYKLLNKVVVEFVHQPELTAKVNHWAGFVLLVYHKQRRYSCSFGHLGIVGTDDLVKADIGLGYAAEDIADKAEDAAEDLADKVEDVAEEIADQAEDAVDAAKDAVEEIKDKLD